VVLVPGNRQVVSGPRRLIVNRHLSPDKEPNAKKAFLQRLSENVRLNTVGFSISVHAHENVRNGGLKLWYAKRTTYLP
jgi:hypothetical protein